MCLSRSLSNMLHISMCMRRWCFCHQSLFVSKLMRSHFMALSTLFLDAFVSVYVSVQAHRHHRVSFDRRRFPVCMRIEIGLGALSHMPDWLNWERTIFFMFISFSLSLSILTAVSCLFSFVDWTNDSFRISWLSALIMCGSLFSSMLRAE